MEDFLNSAYLWVKSFHIIFVIFWMAGLFMMPRFFAYHMQYDAGSEEDQKWQEREIRLLRIIMNPAMIIAWVFGITLITIIGLKSGGWLHVKLLLVVLLSGFHMMLAKTRRRLAAGERPHSEKYFRLINEIPAVFIIAIVILAVAKPF
ncbi:protoporphyrinogen oxidase HemJ [Kordiimonas sp. SCSIO 12610]|uniref:protoporphyrinogen oxidase HemJ n=1 Tax=Kordiimonas sp. SCSIO 12610 TaxID=2829597 RepID=UPI002109F874|nr:protoporphyrinogen oxidase HemJ [Kordiimonas sp. SCSIO 12610]UTW55473.1 protoporphyrinogen oxidase HemJ [Kordiimonas sp. SCSIO 12610]